MSTKRTAVICRATAFIEPLEQRQLMSAALTVVNPLGIPSSSRLVFNVIQHPNTTTPNVTHSTNTLQLKNTGNATLTISSLVLSGPFAFVNAPSGNYANTNIAAGSSITIEIQFTQSTLPPHGSVNETNYTSDPNGGAAITGSLTINSNSATNPSQSVTLAGYWQDNSEDNNEPNLTTIINTIDGYGTTIANTYSVDLTEGASTPTYYGQEVVSDYWQQANTSSNVTVTQIAAFHTQGNTVHTSWYTSTTDTTHTLLTSQANQGQTLLPTFASGAPMTASFNPAGGGFGFKVDNEYSTDSLNVAGGNTSSGGHHVRFYPLLDSTGTVVPNTYIMAMDYAITQTENYDFQDNVYLVSNITPTTAPPAPTNLTATSTAAPALNWTGVTYSNLSGYDVFRSTSVNGTYTKLTSTPITTTSYTDTTAPGGTALYYRVTAVDQTTGNQSAPATASANTPAGPFATPDAFNALSGQATVLNVLANDSDSSGTLTASSVLLSTSPNQGGAASVDPTTGAITYTSAAGFTGTETFSYTVADNNGARSAAGTVTITVAAPSSVTPVAANDTANVLAGSTVAIDVLANDESAGGSLEPSTVTLKSSPTDGTATVNTGTGAIMYTPKAGFVGSDTFTYTDTDSNSDTTNTAKVTVYVGVAAGTGQNKSVTYKDSSGTTGVVTINKGVADIFFSGNGTVSVSKGKATVTGSDLAMNNIGLTGTTTASTLSIKSAGNKGILNLNGLTDTNTDGSLGSLGKVVAPSTVLTGVIDDNTVNLGGLSTLQLASMNTAEVAIGSGTSSFSLLVSGAISGSDLSSGVLIKQLKAASWLNTLNNVIDVAAPAISNLTIAGKFEPNLDATGTGSSLPALGTVKIGGAVDLGYWNVSGVANNLTLGSVSTAWGSTVTAALNKLTVRSGGFASVVSAATFGTVTIAGDLTGSLTAGAAKTIKVNGNITGGSFVLTNSTGTVLSTLTVTGAINGSTISSAGNIGNITANALTSSVLVAGPDDTLGLAAADASTIGTVSINSIKLIGRDTTAFSDSTILADTIKSAALGSVSTSNTTTSGIGATSYGKLLLTVAGKAVKLSAAQLASQTTVDSALSGSSLGNFEVRVI